VSLIYTNKKIIKHYSARKEEEDLKFLIDKFEEDIGKMIANEKTLGEKIEVMEKTMQEYNAVIQGKDKWMDNEKLNMKDVEIQILVLRFINEELIKVINPMKMKLDDLKEFNELVSVLKNSFKCVI